MAFDDSDMPAQLGPVTFLVGAERSGTTLLRLMLDSHPGLAFRSEFELAVELMPDEGGFPDLEAYYAYLHGQRWVDEPPLIDRALDYPALVRSFLEQKRSDDRKPRIGATVHKHFDRLLRIWPDARFIHLVRDGRDVARSCVSMGWYGNAWRAAERWITAERLWNRMTELVPPERRIDVRYEELIADPVAQLTRMCELIGIAYDPAMLSYPARSTYAPPDARQAYQWRRRLAPREVQLIESCMAELLLARGYELSAAVPQLPGPAEQLALLLEDRVGVARSRMRTLGLGLWLESAVASRFGGGAWRHAVNGRINRVINSQLD